jgi:hypothetical protein
MLMVGLGFLLSLNYPETEKGAPKDSFIAKAESEGFEPPDLLQSTVFKTAAFDHSASSPLQKYELGANLQMIFALIL